MTTTDKIVSFTYNYTGFISVVLPNTIGTITTTTNSDEEGAVGTSVVVDSDT